MPSSQGGLTMYTDTNVGFEIDPKIVIAFSTGVGVATIFLNSPMLMGILF